MQMENFIITTEEKLRKLFKELLTEHFSNSKKTDPQTELGDYLEEKQAIQLIGRKTTWFYNMRQAGLLPYSKVGSKTFYCKSDLIKLLENNKK
jgi:hypothetical protein